MENFQEFLNVLDIKTEGLPKFVQVIYKIWGTTRVIFHSFICVKLIFLGSHPYVICHQGDQIENKSSTVLKIDPCL